MCGSFIALWKGKKMKIQEPTKTRRPWTSLDTEQICQGPNANRNGRYIWQRLSKDIATLHLAFILKGILLSSFISQVHGAVQIYPFLSLLVFLKTAVSKSLYHLPPSKWLKSRVCKTHGSSINCSPRKCANFHGHELRPWSGVHTFGQVLCPLGTLSHGYFSPQREAIQPLSSSKHPAVPITQNPLLSD